MDALSYLVPADLHILEHLERVRDLMHNDDISWNVQLIQDIFPQNFSNLILCIPIFVGEQDSLVWNPTSSGKFSVRSSYRTNNHHRFSTASRLDEKVWRLLWKSHLHEWHKSLVWKLLNGTLPTKTRIGHYINLNDLSYFLYNSVSESIDHLLFECPIAVTCWINSPWQIQVSHFATEGCVRWFQILLDAGNLFPMDVADKNKMLHYAVIVFEQMWLVRNQIRFGKCIPDWQKFSDSILKLSHAYWDARVSRALGLHGVVCEKWISPPLGELKMNFDISLIDKYAISAIILRNHSGEIKGV